MVERIIVGSLATNAYIFSQWKKECFLIDPGANAPGILKLLYRLNLRPRAILLTHGHLDHLAAAGDIIAHFKREGHSVPLGIHPSDIDFTGLHAKEAHLNSFSSLGPGGKEYVDSHLIDIPDPEILLEDGLTILDSHLRVIHTPGHTRGSICLYSEKHRTLFSGDTLFLSGQGRTDLPGGNQKDLTDSLNQKIFPLPDETRVFPGHGPNTLLERERRMGSRKNTRVQI